jgi:hypothetical protein
LISVYADGVGEVITKLDGYSERLTEELRTSVNRMTIKLQQKVVQEKLQGQVLGVRTGRGQRSIQMDPATVAGPVVSGVVSTNVFYMIGWEQGWPDGSPGGRQSLKSAKARFDLSATSDAFKNGSPKKRAFLVPSLKELDASGAIKAEFEAAVARSTA